MPGPVAEKALSDVLNAKPGRAVCTQHSEELGEIQVISLLPG